MKIQRFDSLPELFEFAFEQFVSLAEKAIRTSGRFNVAVSGGTTPLPLFEKLPGSGLSSENWKKVNFFWADERWVPHDHPESNYGTAWKAGLQKLPASFYPIDTTLENPEVSCASYSKQIEKITNGFSGFDLVVLGAGTDGHTASVFPADVKNAMQNIVMVTRHPGTSQFRIGLTLAALLESKHTMLILTGNNKKTVLNELLHATEANNPVQIVIFGSADPVILTDIHT